MPEFSLDTYGWLSVDDLLLRSSLLGLWMAGRCREARGGELEDSSESNFLEDLVTVSKQAAIGRMKCLIRKEGREGFSKLDDDLQPQTVRRWQEHCTASNQCRSAVRP